MANDSANDLAKDQMPERPRTVTILCGITLVLAGGFVAFGIYLMLEMMLRPAILIGLLPGIALTAGAVGLLMNRDWAEEALLSGLLIGGLGAFGVAVFSAILIAEGSSFAVVATAAAAVVTVVMFGLAFRFRASDVRSHLMDVRMAKMGSVPGEDEPRVLDFSSLKQTEPRDSEESGSVEDEVEVEVEVEEDAQR